MFEKLAIFPPLTSEKIAAFQVKKGVKIWD